MKCLREAHVPSKQIYVDCIVCLSDGLCFNPIALRMAKTLWSFGHSERSRVKLKPLAKADILIFLIYTKALILTK